MTFNEENAVHEITENTKQQTSETNTAYLVTNTKTGTITHEIQRALRLPKYGSQSETTRIS
jgi:hypothetical protein